MNVKLFTLDGLIVTFLHDLILIGVAACWVWVNVSFLGNDVIAEIGPMKQSAKK
jgi:hypothetical protein